MCPLSPHVCVHMTFLAVKPAVTAGTAQLILSCALLAGHRQLALEPGPGAGGVTRQPQRRAAGTWGPGQAQHPPPLGSQLLAWLLLEVSGETEAASRRGGGAAASSQLSRGWQM